MNTTLAPPARCSAANENGYALIDALLAEQQQTAVERFADFHSRVSPRTPANADGQALYRDLVPLNRPGAGEQYAFEVYLDACSGCKACVAACHSLNGLEESETWRSVGLLVGGNDRLPVLQHVTSACHHCIDPACLIGCPVNAYEKDPLTGIVRHLDDQCIGCQYCIFKCPYDVPVYSRSKGIVRKCDMCRDRLTAGEAPACVQACPNAAIRIRIVDTQETVDGAQANHFLPAAPEPGYTLPTTVYKSERPLPRNMLPADYYVARRQHAHLPLVWMLVLTQLSVGTLAAEQLLWGAGSSRAGVATAERSIHLLAALAAGLAGLFAAAFHLGRPWYAFRAVLGVRTSWLSREIVAFGLYGTLAAGYVALALLRPATGFAAWLEHGFGWTAMAAGLAGVFSSIMIYVDTRRPSWSGTPTTLKFLLTAAVLALPLVLSVSVWSAWETGAASTVEKVETLVDLLCPLLVAAILAKFAVEFSVLFHLRQKQSTPLKRTATLMLGDLRRVTLLRLLFGVTGGVLLPLVLLGGEVLTRGGYHPKFVAVTTLLMLLTLVVGEVLERYSFFATSIAPRMPGVQA
jgi:Fe-S-cluster-containing dehydrogenase component/DMSO reductase anchor subunit